MVPAYRDAVIFIPGLRRGWSDQSIETVARRIAAEFDWNARTARAVFTVEDGSRARPCGAKVSTIIRHEGGEDTPVLDIYGLDYHDILINRFGQSNAVVNSAVLLLVLAVTVPRFLGRLFHWRKASKGIVHTLQLLYCSAVLSMMAFYTATLLVAAGQIVLKALHLTAMAPPPLAKLLMNMWPEIFTIVVTLVTNLFPARRDVLVDAAIDYVSAIRYLMVGERRAAVCGRLAALLEHVAERSDTDYERIHIVAFSFGSIIAIDTLFPHAGPPSRRFGLIDTLVTIGCPFDFIRMFWPEYFQRRQGMPNTPRSWLNVYKSIDVLGSNFRNDDRAEEADDGIAFENGTIVCPSNLRYDGDMKLSIRSWLLMTGLRSHWTYWSGEDEETSCFGSIVRRMYADSKAMA
jgi:hypothetical protein